MNWLLQGREACSSGKEREYLDVEPWPCFANQLHLQTPAPLQENAKAREHQPREPSSSSCGFLGLEVRKSVQDSRALKFCFCPVASPTFLGAICLRGGCLSSYIGPTDNPCGLFNNLGGGDYLISASFSNMQR